MGDGHRLPTYALTLLAGAATLVAQSPPVFRAGVELVQVDVVVLDKQGQPVRGLAASDFTLLDRKKPREVATFAAVDFDREPASAALFPRDLVLDVADNQSARSTRIIALVVDDLHISQAAVPRARALVFRLLDELGPQASVGLIFTSGNRGVELTQDRAQVNKALTKDWKKPVTLGGYPDTERMHTTIRDVARMMGVEATRRKAVLLISPGLSYDVTGLFEGMSTRPDLTPPTQGFTRVSSGGLDRLHTDRDLLDMMNALRRSNVATYAINPLSVSETSALDLAGNELVTSADRPAVESRLGRSTGFFWNRASEHMRGYLDSIASASGGFAITDPKTFDDGVRVLLNDLDHYYMLGFYPTDSGKGWRDIEVRVSRPDVVVRFRKGYELGTVPPLPKNTHPLAGFSAGVLPSTDLPLKMFATPLPSTGKLTRMAITLQIRSDVATLTEPDRLLRDTLDILTMAVDLNSRKIVKAIQRKRFVTLKPKPDTPLRDTVSYQIVSEWELPPGSFQLRTSVTSAKMKKAGSVYLETDVPDFRKSTVQLSGLVVGYGDPKRHAVDGTVVEHSLFPIEPVLDRAFARADQLRAYYDVWRRSPDIATTTSIEILDRQDRVVYRRSDAIPPGTVGHVDATVPLSDLAPGPYRLRIGASDGSHTVSRIVGFLVQ